MRPGLLLLLLPACAFGDGSALDVDPANLPGVVTWEDHVGVLFDDYCSGCHGPQRHIEGLDFTQYQSVRCRWGEVRGMVLSGRPHPPGGAPRPDAWELATMERWAEQGFPESLDAAGEPVFGSGCGR